MAKMRSVPRVVVLLLDVVGVALLIFLALYFLNRGDRADAVQPAPDPTEAVKAQVTEILEAGTVEINGLVQPYQLLRVRVLEGSWAGEEVEVDYGRTQMAAPGLSVRQGEQILVSLIQKPDGSNEAYFVDFVRTRAMLVLLGLFVVSSIILSGWKGIRSMLAMLFSFAVIVWFILPRILQGENPVTVSTIGAFVILATTLYVVYGWTLKTHAAVLGTLMALSVTGILAYYFIGFSHLTGFGSEEAMFLNQQFATRLDLRGLVLSGILIGALGVLDDLVITQASAVFELHVANPAMRFAELYRHAMRIGQDHVAATVNTLVLAYTGAALPLLLLVSMAGERFVSFINREFVTEEVIRTLVGSLGLISAVPLTTALACLVVLYHHRLGRFRPYFGPLSLSGGHEHHHH
jgi:uncharacterized membrane protein